MSDERFELSHFGSYVSAPVGPPVTYVGPSDVSLTVEDNVAGPLAAYSGTCDPDDTSWPVPGQIGITGVHIEGDSLAGGSVTCDGVTNATPAVYTRVNNAVVFTFTTTCDISGPLASVSDVPVTHVIEGTMNVCNILPPVEVLDNPECAVIEDPAEPPGSHLVTSYEAVAV